MASRLASFHGIDFGDKDTFVGLVLGIARLALKATLDDHAEFFIRVLFNANLPEALRERVMLNFKLHSVSLDQEGNHSFLGKHFETLKVS